MDQKVMELLAKIYQTQTEMQGEFKELRTEVRELRTEVRELRTEVGELRTEVGELRTEVGELRTEVGGLKTEVGELKTEVGELKTDQETIAQNVAKLIVVFEHDVSKKIGVIFDFREIQIEHNQKTDQALGRIEAKVEVLQLETSSLRRIK